MKLDTKEIQEVFWSRDKRTRRRPDHPVVSATFNPLADFVQQHCVDKPENSSVLDVGCGNGFLQLPLEDRFGTVEGCDTSETMLGINPCKKTHLASCTNLPFANKSFDIVVAANLFHHLTETDRTETLLEMRRVARNSVISFEPNRNNLLIFFFSALKQEERMALKFTSNYMQKLFTAAGFVDVHSHVENWIVPNQAPNWWIPISRILGRTPLRKLGFTIFTVGQV